MNWLLIRCRDFFKDENKMTVKKCTDYWSNLFENPIKEEFIEVPFHIYIPHCELIEVSLVMDEIKLFKESFLREKVMEIAELLREKIRKKGEGYSFFSPQLIYRPPIFSYDILKLNALLTAQCMCSKENVKKIVLDYEKGKVCQ